MSLTMRQKMTEVHLLLGQLEQEIQIEIEVDPNNDNLKIAKAFFAISKSNFTAANKLVQPKPTV